jgi:hypothetical protein
MRPSFSFSYIDRANPDRKTTQKRLPIDVQILTLSGSLRTGCSNPPFQPANQTQPQRSRESEEGYWYRWCMMKGHITLLFYFRDCILYVLLATKYEDDSPQTCCNGSYGYDSRRLLILFYHLRAGNRLIELGFRFG